MRMFKKSVLVTCCISLMGLAGCSSNSVKVENNSVSTAQSFDQSQRIFIAEKPYNIESLPAANTIKVIDYRMPNVLDKSVQTSALVFFPKTAKPKGGYKIVVWQHGTLGVSNYCAPTENKLNNRFKDPLANSLLQAGYVVVAPDYEGLGGEGIHPYLHMDSEAKSSVYAVKAVQEKYAGLVSKDWATVGQSQGGQASLATAEYIARHPDPHYKGAVAAAPASNLDKIIFDIAPQALASAEKKEKAAGLSIDQRETGSIHALATLLSYASFYGIGIQAVNPDFDYLDVFSDQRVKDLAKLSAGTNGQDGLCLESNNVNKPEKSVRYHFIQDIKKFLKDNPEKSITDYPTLDRERFYGNEDFEKAVEASNPGSVKIEVPLMIIQGTEDMAVPYYVTEKIKNEYLRLGTNVTFVPVKGASHSEAIVQKNAELVSFIQAQMPAE